MGTLTLNFEIWLFSQSSLKCLGHLLEGQGVGKDASKVKTIVDMAEPQNIWGLRRFFGIVNEDE